MQYVSTKFIRLSPFPQFDVVYRDKVPVYNNVGGGGEVAYYDVMRYWPQNTLSTHFRAVWARCAKEFLLCIVDRQAGTLI